MVVTGTTGTGHSDLRFAPADFGTADLALQDTLASLEATRNYNSWIFGLIRPYLGSTVLEVGAGHGTFTELLARDADRVVAVDLSERCVDQLRARFPDDSGVEVVHGDVDVASARGPFDTVVMINVLEHIEDDDRALRELRASLRPGGMLALWVPALPLLYSQFDRKIGHHRRYRHRALRSLLTDTGFVPVECRYVNMVGALGWFAGMRLLGRTPSNETLLRLADRYVLPIGRRCESRLSPPFGQSLLAIAARPR